MHLPKPQLKILVGSLIFISLWSTAVTFATTYVAPGYTLDPLGGPGSYTVTPPISYGNSVTTGHNGEVLYTDSSGNLASDTNFKFDGLDLTMTSAGAIKSKTFGIFNSGQTASTNIIYSGVVDQTLSLPLTSGSNGQVLTTDGSGTLTWQTPTGGGITDLTQDISASGSGSVSATVVGWYGVPLKPQMATPTGGDFIYYEGAGQKWQNGAIGGDLINLSGTSNITVDGFYQRPLDTVTFGTPNDGDIPTYDTGTGKWISAAPSSSSISVNGNNNLYSGTIHAGFSLSSGLNNILLGHNAGYLTSTGNQNVFIGDGSGSNNSTGSNNVFLGVATGSGNTTGFNNIFTGVTVGYSNTSGSHNIFSGNYAGYNNTTGSNNIFIGQTAGENQVGVSDQIGIGEGALRGSGTTSGVQNTAVGYQALYSNATGYNNTALGYQALNTNSTGYYNTALGTGTLQFNSTGSQNSATGTGALLNNSTGSSNTANGFSALSTNSSGSGNVAIGLQALYSNTTGNENVANGDSVLYSNTTGGHNIASGYKALYSNTGGYYNQANGYESLYSNTNGIYNLATGYQSLRSNLTGNYNIALGFTSLYSNTTGLDNVAIGSNALYNTTNNYNTAVGSSSGQSNISGVNNTYLGYNAGSTDGTVVTANNLSNSTAIGYNSQVTTSNSLILGGVTSPYLVNVGIGLPNPAYVLDVKSDVASYTANFFNDGNSAARRGLFIQTGLDDSTAAGPSTLIGFADGDGGAIGSITFGSSATAYNTTSDRRLKENIVDTALSIDLLNQIHIRDFTWISDVEHKLSHGVIAQELYDVYPLAVTKPVDESVDNWMVDYSKLVPLTVKAIQDLALKIQPLEDLNTSGNSFSDNLRSWLANASNSISRIFTGEICLTEAGQNPECINRGQLYQLKQLLNSQNQSGGTPPPPDETPLTCTPPQTLNTDGTACVDPVPDVTPPPDPDPTPDIIPPPEETPPPTQDPVPPPTE